MASSAITPSRAAKPDQYRLPAGSGLCRVSRCEERVAFPNRDAQHKPGDDGEEVVAWGGDDVDGEVEGCGSSGVVHHPVAPLLLLSWPGLTRPSRYGRARRFTQSGSPARGRR
ncbi:hypothetical protein J4G37_21300 [Microvirga sp. 3-52]|nr:hypothetical protein [Microvirga sp. 3-52]